MKSSGSKWGESKLRFAIGGVKTNSYRIRDCISSMLSIIDKLALFASICSGNEKLFSTKTTVSLQDQEDYVCLLGMQDEYLVRNDIPPMIYSKLIKQRSPNWLAIRAECKISGSTMRRALGLQMAQFSLNNVHKRGIKHHHFLDCKQLMHRKNILIDWSKELYEIHAIGTSYLRWIENLANCSPRTNVLGAILWLSHCFAAASVDTSR